MTPLALVALIFMTGFSTLSALTDKCEENNLNALMVHFRKLHTDFKHFKESYETQKNASLEELKVLKSENDQKSKEIQQLNEALQNMTDQFKKQIVELESENEQKTKEVQQLNEALQNMTDQLKEKIVELESDNEQKSKEIQQLNEALQNTTDQLKEQNVELERLTNLTVEKQTTPLVSFVVRQSQVHYNCVTKLPFESILLNEGNAFDKTSNSFKAPYDGFYSLTAQLCSHVDSQFDFSVYSPKYNKIYGASRNGITNDHDCRSLTTVAKLVSNEEVYVHVNCPGQGQIEGHIDDDFWTMFSGILIHLSP